MSKEVDLALLEIQTRSNPHMLLTPLGRPLSSRRYFPGLRHQIRRSHQRVGHTIWVPISKLALLSTRRRYRSYSFVSIGKLAATAPFTYLDMSEAMQVQVFLGKAASSGSYASSRLHGEVVAHC